MADSCMTARARPPTHLAVGQAAQPPVKARGGAPDIGGVHTRVLNEEEADGIHADVLEYPVRSTKVGAISAT